MENEQIKKVLGLFLLMQAQLELIDDMDILPVMVRELKRDTNRYYKSIELKVQLLTAGMDINEADYYIKIVQELKGIVDGIEIETKIN